MVAKVINALLLSLAALGATLQCCGFLLSIVKPPPEAVTRIWPEFDVTRIRSRVGGLSHVETFTWKKLTPTETVTRLGGSLYHWQIKMRDYMDRGVTPPKRVTSGS